MTMEGGVWLYLHYHVFLLSSFIHNCLNLNSNTPITVQHLPEVPHQQKKMPLDEISRGIDCILGTLQPLCPATTRSNPCRSCFARCARRVLDNCSITAREKNILNFWSMKIIALVHDFRFVLYFPGCHMLCSLRRAGFLQVVKSPNLPRSIAYFTRWIQFFNLLI